MATNPLFRNEFYFFSGMYEDSVVTSFYNKISDEAYSRAKSYQMNAMGHDRIAINAPVVDIFDLDELEINDAFNAKFGFSTASRRIALNNIVLPIANKKRYLRAYGSCLQIIPMEDILSQTDIFEKIISVYIGDYRIIKGSFVVDSDSTLYYVIDASSTNGVSYSSMSSLIDGTSEGKIIFTTNERTTMCTHTSTFNSIITGATTTQYQITIPISSRVAYIPSPYNVEAFNAWTCMLSYNSTYGQNILTSCSASLVSMDSTSMIFLVNLAPINDVKTRLTTGVISFYHMPYMSNAYYYMYSDDVLPIILPYTDNSSANININIHEFDVSTELKGRKLYDESLTQIYFPNIFDFSSLNTRNKDLVIEITEYPTTFTNQTMHNSLLPLINVLGESSYTSMMVNHEFDGNVADDKKLSTFSPSDFPVDSNDYMSSEYFGDLRGYLLDKVYSTFLTDSELYMEYLEHMKVKDQKVHSVSGFPDTIGFGGLSDLGTKFTGAYPTVNSTILTTAENDDVLYFSEVHSYVAYRSSAEEVPADIYFGGIYVEPTTTKYYNGVNYAYFPVSTVKAILSPIAARITDGSLADPMDPIIVDIYLDCVMDMNDTETDSIDISALEESFNIFEDATDKSFRISDILMYTDSGKLVDVVDSFDFTISVTDSALSTVTSDSDIDQAVTTDINYLYTLYSELYTTADDEPIILSYDTTTLTLNTLAQALVDEGIYDSLYEAKSSLVGKMMSDISIVNFIVDSSSLIGSTLTVRPSNFKHMSYRYGSHIVEVDGVKTLTFNAACVGLDGTRYEVFCNGLSLHKVEDGELVNTIFPSGTFMGDVTVTLPDGEYADSDKFTLVWQPVAMENTIANVVCGSSENITHFPFFADADLIDTTVEDAGNVFAPVTESSIENTSNMLTTFMSGKASNCIDKRCRYYTASGNRLCAPKFSQGTQKYYTYLADEISTMYADGLMFGISDYNDSSNKAIIIERSPKMDTPIYDITINPTELDALCDDIVASN